MKVSGPGKTGATSGVSKAKKADKAEAVDESFGDMMVSAASGPSAVAPTTATQSIAQVDALLAVQGADDPTARAAKQRMRKRSDDVLDALDNVRMAMLGGNLTVGHMVDIADVVASHRENIDDPQLTAIMDEIDLRAQVELAKMRVILDQKEKS